MTVDARLSRRGRIGRIADGELEIILDGAGADREAAGAVCPGRGLGCHLCGGRRTVRWVAGLPASGTEQFRPSDRVQLSVDRVGLRAVAVRAFAVPLAALVAGAAVGDWLGGDPLSVAIGGAGLLVALVWLRGRGAALLELLAFECRAHPVPLAPAETAPAETTPAETMRAETMRAETTPAANAPAANARKGFGSNDAVRTRQEGRRSDQDVAS